MLSIPKVYVGEVKNYDPLKLREAVTSLLEYTQCRHIFRSGDSVLIKPNFVMAPKQKDHPVVTNPFLLMELIKCMKDLGTRPFLADSPGWGNPASIARKIGLSDFCSKNQVPIKKIRHLRFQKNPFPFGPKWMPVSKDVLEADHVINVPKLKSHTQMYLTLSVKNLFGCVPGRLKAFFHNWYGKNPHRFTDLILANALMIKPCLHIVDGISAMHKAGPMLGEPLPLGLLFAGTDPITVDQIICHMIQADLQQVKILQSAKKNNLMPFSVSDIETSVPLNSLSPLPIFHHVEFLAPVQFNLYRVIRGLIKNWFTK